MKVAEESKSASAKSQIQAKQEPFFRKVEENGFFSKSKNATTSFFSPAGVQPKLKIGKPNDKYEVEADEMADKVVQRLSDPSIKAVTNGNKLQAKCATCEEKEKLQKKEEDEISENDIELQGKSIFESNAEQPETDIQTKVVTPFVQTKCAACEQEEKLQKKEEEAAVEEPIVQTKLNNENDGDDEVQPKLMLKKTEEKPPEEEEPVQLKEDEEQLQKNENQDEVRPKSNDEVASSDLQSQLNSSKGGGSTLPDDTKSSMESGFDADFSNVRIHTGTQANEMNSELGARAFTHGSDIYFNKGEYNPNTTSGQHLLAHELTHTVQQGAVVRQKPKQSYHQTQPKIQGLFGRIWSAAKSVGKAAWSGVKKAGSAVVKAVSKGVDWILGKISPILKRIPGYTLLTVILGKDIITGDQVDRNGPNLIKGFIGLVPGGHDLWMKLEESKMITDAFSWLNGEITKLGLSWSAIKTAFKTAVSSISVTDVFSPLEAFNTKIKPIFAPILAKILTLSKKVVKKVAEFVLEGFLRLAGPFGKKVMDILRKAGDTFWTIVGDPIAFLNNLIKAVKGGVNKFKTNIKKHLIGGLIGWLTGAMGDLPIQIPQTFDVKGVLHLGLQIMGVTWENIRQKLVKRVGEPLVKAAETGVTIVKTLITQGPMGLWEMLKEKAVEIKQTIMGGIRNWVITQLVKQGIIKILSFLNPAGALVQAALAIYNGVMFFVENWQRISDFVNSIFSSIAKIAAGNLASAMTFIEKAMAQSIPVILSFIARLLNIGAIGKAIKKIIQKIRKPIDKVIRKVIDFIAKQVRKLFGKGKKKKAGKYTEKDRNAAKKAIPKIEKRVAKDGKVSEVEATKTASSSKKSHPVIKTITPVLKNKTYNYNVIFRKNDEVKTPLPAENKKDILESLNTTEKQKLQKMHPKAKEELQKVTKSQKNVFSNENTLKKVIQTARLKTSYKNVYEKPLNLNHKYGKQVSTSKNGGLVSVITKAKAVLKKASGIPEGGKQKIEAVNFENTVNKGLKDKLNSDNATKGGFNLNQFDKNKALKGIPNVVKFFVELIKSRVLNTTRADQANNFKPPISDLIRATAGAYRDNLVSDIQGIFNTKKQSIDEFVEIYKYVNQPFKSKLDQLKSKAKKGKNISKTEIINVFKGYEAHHVIPANFLWKNKTVQTLLAQDGIEFGYNHMDNLIFIPKENHLQKNAEGKYYWNHPHYNLAIETEISKKLTPLISQGEYEMALVELKKIVARAKNKFSEVFIKGKMHIDTKDFFNVQL